MYNLSNTLDEKFIKDNLNRLIKEVDKVQELFGIELYDLKDQDKLNKIHSVFEENHGKLDEWQKNNLFSDKPDLFRKNLSEINQFVHACEGIGGSPKIRIVWFDLPKTQVFDDSDYDLFTNRKTFGSLYHLYSDVGKNLESLTEDNDDHHHDVVPNLHYSADCVCYFSDDSEEQVNVIEEAQKKYIERNAEYLSEKGYAVGDKKLTTGRIEIARLETDLTKEELMNKIKNFNHIQSFFLS